jgi:hypothetical protein
MEKRWLWMVEEELQGMMANFWRVKLEERE